MEHENKFEIVEQIAVVSKKANGNRLELNVVSWNEDRPSFDLRWWSKDGKPLKGVRFNERALLKLSQVIDEVDFQWQY